MDGLTLPQNPWLWGVIAAGVVVVVLYALSRRHGELTLKGGGMEVKVNRNAPGQGEAINVANRLVVDGEVGEILGRRGAGGGQGRPVSVANDAIIKGKVDRIVGDESSSRRSGEDPGSGS